MVSASCPSPKGRAEQTSEIWHHWEEGSQNYHSFWTMGENSQTYAALEPNQKDIAQAGSRTGQGAIVQQQSKQ